jgi:hypothetical protein
MTMTTADITTPLPETEVRANRRKAIDALRVTNHAKICGKFVIRDGPWESPGPVVGCCAVPIIAEALGLADIEDWGNPNWSGSGHVSEGLTRMLDFEESRIYVLSDSTETFTNTANVLAIIWDLPLWEKG